MLGRLKLGILWQARRQHTRCKNRTRQIDLSQAGLKPQPTPQAQAT